MSEFVCPDCRGGFDDRDYGGCPWCGTEMDGEYDPQPLVSRVESVSERDEPNTLTGRLFS